MDLVSIIMPYYKKSATIKQTINSILSQTYTNFELIIIYDDENSNELDILKKNNKQVKKNFYFKK